MHFSFLYDLVVYFENACPDDGIEPRQQESGRGKFMRLTLVSQIIHWSHKVTSSSCWHRYDGRREVGQGKVDILVVVVPLDIGRDAGAAHFILNNAMFLSALFNMSACSCFLTGMSLNKMSME